MMLTCVGYSDRVLCECDCDVLFIVVPFSFYLNLN